MTIMPTVPGAELDVDHHDPGDDPDLDAPAGRMSLADTVAVARGDAFLPGRRSDATDPGAVLRSGVRVIEALCDELEAEGVTVPRETRRAFALERDIVDALAVTDPVEWLAAHQDLDDVNGDDVAAMLHHATVGAHVQTHARIGGTRPLFEALRQRGVDALADALPGIVDQLRPAWDAAAAVVAAAASTGLRSSTTAGEAIDLGDDAVTAWRALAEDTTDGIPALNRLASLLDRLRFYCGYHVRDDERARRGRAWLDACTDGPVELHAPLVAAVPDDDPTRRFRTRPAGSASWLERESAGARAGAAATHALEAEAEQRYRDAGVFPVIA